MRRFVWLLLVTTWLLQPAHSASQSSYGCKPENDLDGGAQPGHMPRCCANAAFGIATDRLARYSR